MGGSKVTSSADMMADVGGVLISFLARSNNDFSPFLINDIISVGNVPSWDKFTTE